MLDSVLPALAEPQTWLLVSAGFVAQMLDGALGMGFGAVSSTVLAAAGVPREIASASVNGAKIFTGAASGAAHLALRNVDASMLLVLCVSGAAGGLIGALLISRFAGPWVGAVVSGYLLLVGVFIIWQARRPANQAIRSRRVGGVGIAGGLLEAVSGIWGPLVTSNLIAFGANPRRAVGTGNVAETLVAGVVFAILVGHLGAGQLSLMIVCLLCGALIAAPFAARLARDLPGRTLMIGVGALVIVLSLIRLYRDLGV